MNVFVTSDRCVSIPLDRIVGSFRTFGRAGPAYEVLSAVEPSSGDHVLLRIRVIESGEELDYPLADAMDDPLAS